MSVNNTHGRMKAYYTDEFVLPLPPGHRFPMRKYAELRERILATRTLPPQSLIIPPPATDEDILRCHDADYLESVKKGQLSRREILRIGFPWSPEMVERSRRSAGATISAARTALSEGIAANLAGGTHHAGRDHGEGYCVFNDAAIAARAMQAEGRVERVIILDCDVHQGNGTAAIAAQDPSIYTFSIHGEKNFPFRKIAGDLDIGLPNNTDDEAYLSVLETALSRILAAGSFDMAIYIAGADPYEGDKLGKLALSKAGLLARDQMVLDHCRVAGLPLAVTMGGGYAPQIEDIVDIHLQTIQAAVSYHSNWEG